MNRPWARVAAWLAFGSPLIAAVLIASVVLGFVAFVYVVTEPPR